jgi:hypothetical protein
MLLLQSYSGSNSACRARRKTTTPTRQQLLLCSHETTGNKIPVVASSVGLPCHVWSWEYIYFFLTGCQAHDSPAMQYTNLLPGHVSAQLICLSPGPRVCLLEVGIKIDGELITEPQDRNKKNLRPNLRKSKP